MAGSIIVSQSARSMGDVSPGSGGAGNDIVPGFTDSGPSSFLLHEVGGQFGHHFHQLEAEAVVVSLVGRRSATLAIARRLYYSPVCGTSVEDCAPSLQSWLADFSSLPSAPLVQLEVRDSLDVALRTSASSSPGSLAQRHSETPALANLQELVASCHEPVVEGLQAEAHP